MWQDVDIEQAADLSESGRLAASKCCYGLHSSVTATFPLFRFLSVLRLSGIIDLQLLWKYKL